jgi:ATP-dependent protease Clp ATPase subunit
VIFKDLPNSIYKLSQAYFASVGVTLEIPERIMRIIAARASKNNRIGARSLKETYYHIIRHYEFDPFSSGLIKKTPQGNVLEITEDVVRKHLGKAA